jgi:hypothetical protein
MKFLYYFDKVTAWLDFSWLITREKPPKYDTIYAHADTNVENHKTFPTSS